MATATWKDTVIADTEDASVVVDGNIYFPKDDLNMEFFSQSEHTSVCGWKGTAEYYNVVVGGETNNNACWYYDTPKDGASEIAGRAAFWKGVTVAKK